MFDNRTDFAQFISFIVIVIIGKVKDSVKWTETLFLL